MTLPDLAVFPAQVASGDIPSFVTEQDIVSTISFEEAHSRYAASVTAFITTQSAKAFTEEEVVTAEIVFLTL